MEPGPEVEAHRHGSTGARWLDIMLAVTAMTISLISLMLGIKHGEIMERVVHENARMVQASTWPYVTISDSNGDQKGRLLYRIELHNSGVGPAKIKSISFWYDGRWQADALTMSRTIAAEAGVTAKGVVSSDTGGVVPARETIELLQTLPATTTPQTIAALSHARDRLDVRVCYCSLFDDCWTTTYSGERPEPRPVKVCADG